MAMCYDNDVNGITSPHVLKSDCNMVFSKGSRCNFKKSEIIVNFV